MKSNVMKAAHEIRKNEGVSMSVAMKMAWSIAKKGGEMVKELKEVTAGMMIKFVEIKDVGSKNHPCLQAIARQGVVCEKGAHAGRKILSETGNKMIGSNGVHSMYEMSADLTSIVEQINNDLNETNENKQNSINRARMYSGSLNMSKEMQEELNRKAKSNAEYREAVRKEQDEILSQIDPCMFGY